MTLARVESSEPLIFADEGAGNEDAVVAARLLRVMGDFRDQGIRPPWEISVREVGDTIESEINDARRRFRKGLWLVPCGDVDAESSTPVHMFGAITEEQVLATCAYDMIKALKGVDKSIATPQTSAEVADEMQAAIDEALEAAGLPKLGTEA